MKKDIKTTHRHFELFKKECRDFIDFFELNNWKVYFVHGNKDRPNAYATTRTKVSGYVATIFFASNWAMDGVDDIDESIRETAKHEMIHLLLARFSSYAGSKDYTSDDLYEAEEELVRKLTKLI